MDSSQLIMETAERLFLRYGLKSVSMDDVASEAGISKKTLYQVVASKAELIDRIIESHICTETETIQALRENTTNALEELLAISEMVLPHCFSTCASITARPGKRSTPCRRSTFTR